MSGSPLSGDSHGGLAMTTERDDSQLPVNPAHTYEQWQKEGRYPRHPYTLEAVPCGPGRWNVTLVANAPMGDELCDEWESVTPAQLGKLTQTYPTARLAVLADG